MVDIFKDNSKDILQDSLWRREILRLRGINISETNSLFGFLQGLALVHLQLMQEEVVTKETQTSRYQGVHPPPTP